LISSASVGLAADGYNIQPGTLRPLIFGGEAFASIPPGAPALSDAIDLPLAPGTELVVSVHVSGQIELNGQGGGRIQVGPGDQTMRAVLEEAKHVPGRPVVSGVMGLTERPTSVIVALGDSITDGNRRIVGLPYGWPDELARRLAGRGAGGTYSVVNAGIGGNRLLSAGWGDAGLARLDRDALRIDAIAYLIVLEGTNDIGMSAKSVFGDNPPVSAADLIAGYRQVIARAHARGVKVAIGTITPFGGSATHDTRPNEQVREAVNRWIRASGEPDAVVDFDEIVRDPKAPAKIRADFDSGDHLHPSAAGLKAMGDGINLAIFP